MESEGNAQDAKLEIGGLSTFSVHFNEGKNETWTFTRIRGLHVSLTRSDGTVYVRSPLTDPRNGSEEGMFFYQMLTHGTMQRIRVYCDENGFITGDIRRNSVNNYFEDWKLVDFWKTIMAQ